MRVLVSGASGLIGKRLVRSLGIAGHSVGRLVRDRSKAGPDDVFWNPETGEIDAAKTDSADAVVNLAGETIASRWSAEKKRRIRDSRIAATRTIAEALTRRPGAGRVLVNASAVGYYGNRGDEQLDEQSSPGSDDFLSEVCQAWEAAAEPAARAGVRVAFVRFGVVLAGEGGALKTMLLPFKLGLGGKIGSGRQYMAWVTVDDAVGAITHLLTHPELSGPFNVVAPEQVTNLQYTKTLGRVLSRPTLFPMPAVAARLAFGQMADELLLASQRVAPTRLRESGYAFGYPHLEGALRHVLGK